MTRRRVTAPLLQQAFARWILAPLEPILHPSPWRLRLLGLAMFGGHPLFYGLWSSWLKQPYENAWLRFLMSMLALLLLVKPVNGALSSRRTGVLFTAIMWLELPLFFSWMYLCNAGGNVWLPSLCVIVLVYYHVTDWRIATLGTISGALVAGGLFYLLNPDSPAMTAREHAPDAVLMAFSWGCALLLGVSSANLRRDHLSHTLATMGIMAHELRTPLSTAALIGDAIRLEIQRQPDLPCAAKLDRLGLRLQTLVRSMNHQIDMQIANASLLQLPQYLEPVGAGALVREAVASYPYVSSRHKECVQVTIHEDFIVCVSAVQFSQVLDNLIKNALYALTAADSLYPPGALRIDVLRTPSHGCIVVADEGIGIEPALLSQIFKPFFSSNRSTGHGLGLAFCQQVVHNAGGNIQVKSGPSAGAIFTIMMPLPHHHP